MTANAQALLNELKQNPQLISELCETMADAICILVLDTDTQDPDIKNIIDKLAGTRLDLRKFVIE